MHVLFVEPGFPRNQGRFVQALAAVGARVTGIGEAPIEGLSRPIRDALYGYERVRSVVDDGELFGAVRRVQEREWVDRMEATVEAHILPAARVREATSIPGISVRTAHLCRDKPAMKEELRAAGIPCAASAGVSSAAEAHAFAERVGFPLIIKPRDAAGAAGTERLDGPDDLRRAIVSHGLESGASAALEEFVEGHEAFYDTLTIGGRIAVDFVSHYYPGVLDAMQHRWISPIVITTNRLGEPGYDEVREMGRRVIERFGIGTAATHMEWFFGPRGLRFSEIGCRPPGVGIWDLYCTANEFDLYREWASAVVHGRSEQPPSRRYAAGMVALRPDRDGRIAGYEGVDEIQGAFDEWILDAHLPEPGSPTQPVSAGYMANAWVRMRHPDYDELRGMLEAVGRTLKVRAV